jgi:hypothetical protein
VLVVVERSKEGRIAASHHMDVLGSNRTCHVTLELSSMVLLVYPTTILSEYVIREPGSRIK